MTDKYVYYFIRRGPTGKNIVSNRQATLETIKDMGEAVMESRTVVDHTEVDGNGFLIGGADSESSPLDELWTQIRSLERRANSRESEALKLDERTAGERKYMLRVESRELRKEAERLKKHHVDLMAGGLGTRIDGQGCDFLGGSLTTC